MLVGKVKRSIDRSNHVAACSSVNRSKTDSRPSDFLRKSSDGKGRDYDLVAWCDYVAKYVAVKQKYGLIIRQDTKEYLSSFKKGGF